MLLQSSVSLESSVFLFPFLSSTTPTEAGTYIVLTEGLGLMFPWNHICLSRTMLSVRQNQPRSPAVARFVPNTRVP